LKSQLSVEQLATYHTAVQYQMYHAIGLVLVGLLGLHHQSRWFDGAGWAMLVGVVLFSGSPYQTRSPHEASSWRSDAWIFP
jgi:uncharacterized membrane protein YgdD (TMEM256/DUF423 family)